MGQQMGQCHKDIIIYIGKWRTMQESSQSGKHVTCLGMGLMGTFSGPKSLAVQKFFNALWAGLTNPRDISDSFNENPLVGGERTWQCRKRPSGTLFDFGVRGI